MGLVRQLADGSYTKWTPDDDDIYTDEEERRNMYADLRKDYENTQARITQDIQEARAIEAKMKKSYYFEFLTGIAVIVILYLIYTNLGGIFLKSSFVNSRFY